MSATSFKTPSPAIVEDLEKQLLFSLRPVQPSQEFVNHLQHRLTSPPAMTVEREYRVLGLLLIAASLFSGLMMVLLMRRLRAA
jgi:hypothetical protein